MNKHDTRRLLRSMRSKSIADMLTPTGRACALGWREGYKSGAPYSNAGALVIAMARAELRRRAANATTGAEG